MSVSQFVAHLKSSLKACLCWTDSWRCGSGVGTKFLPLWQKKYCTCQDFWLGSCTWSHPEHLGCALSKLNWIPNVLNIPARTFCRYALSAPLYLFYSSTPLVFLLCHSEAKPWDTQCAGSNTDLRNISQYFCVFVITHTKYNYVIFIGLHFCEWCSDNADNVFDMQSFNISLGTGGIDNTLTIEEALDLDVGHTEAQHGQLVQASAHILWEGQQTSQTVQLPI